MITDAQGRHIYADTRKNWRESSLDINSTIADEADGKQPGGGTPTWNERWVRWIRGIQETQENAPKYIAYIIESRRRAGLLELDMTTDAQDRYMVADTPLNWQRWRWAIDPQIADEAAGRPSEGWSIWNQRWIWRIRTLDELQENALKYIAYIIESRQRAGLPEIEITTDAQGQHILADTPQNWQQWRSVIDPQIADEAAGERPRINTWKQEWIRQIEQFEKIQENAPKYIDYIIESRRRTGLPELEYDPPK